MNTRRRAKKAKETKITIPIKLNKVSRKEFDSKNKSISVPKIKQAKTRPVVIEFGESSDEDEDQIKEKKENSNSDIVVEVVDQELGQCVICFEDVPDLASIDSCSHQFCFSCIDKWVTETTNLCPLCKSTINRISFKDQQGLHCSKHVVARNLIQPQDEDDRPQRLQLGEIRLRPGQRRIRSQINTFVNRRLRAHLVPGQQLITGFFRPRQ